LRCTRGATPIRVFDQFLFVPDCDAFHSAGEQSPPASGTLESRKDDQEHKGSSIPPVPFRTDVNSDQMKQDSDSTKETQVRRGRKLEYFTIVYNCLEGLIAIIAGLIAGSVSLVGFGIDSAIEVTSGTALLWRLRHEFNPERREPVERATLRIVGLCFIALAIYILYDSISILLRHEAPERSIPGIVLAAVSVVVMPLLARSKRQVAANINSAAMQAVPTN
jgi:hypothetical protein